MNGDNNVYHTGVKELYGKLNKSCFVHCKPLVTGYMFYEKYFNDNALSVP